MAAIDLKNVLRLLRSYLTERDLTVADLNAQNVDDLFSSGITKSQIEILLKQLEYSVTENFILRKSGSTDNFITSNDEIEKDEYSYLKNTGFLYFVDTQGASYHGAPDRFHAIDREGNISFLGTSNLLGRTEGLSFSPNGDLYAIDDNSNKLYKINLSDISNPTLIMNLGGDTYYHSWDTLAIDSDNTFYTIRLKLEASTLNETAKLYKGSITNPDTSPEFVGNLSNDTDDITNIWYALAFHPDGTLYSINNNDNKLYSINKTTGIATPYGQLESRVWEGMTFDNDGILYAIEVDERKVYKINISDSNNITEEVFATGPTNTLYSIAFNPFVYRIVQKFKNTVKETLIKSPKIYSVLNSDTNAEVDKVFVDSTNLINIKSDYTKNNIVDSFAFTKEPSWLKYFDYYYIGKNGTQTNIYSAGDPIAARNATLVNGVLNFTSTPGSSFRLPDELSAKMASADVTVFGTIANNSSNDIHPILFESGNDGRPLLTRWHTNGGHLNIYGDSIQYRLSDNYKFPNNVELGVGAVLRDASATGWINGEEQRTANVIWNWEADDAPTLGENNLTSTNGNFVGTQKQVIFLTTNSSYDRLTTNEKNTVIDMAAIWATKNDANKILLEKINNNLKIVEKSVRVFANRGLKEATTGEGGWRFIQNNPSLLNVSGSLETPTDAASTNAYKGISIGVSKTNWDKMDKIILTAAHANQVWLGTSAPVYKADLIAGEKVLVGATGTGRIKIKLYFEEDKNEEDVADTNSNRLVIEMTEGGTTGLYIGEVILQHSEIS